MLKLAIRIETNITDLLNAMIGQTNKQFNTIKQLINSHSNTQQVKSF